MWKYGTGHVCFSIQIRCEHVFWVYSSRFLHQEVPVTVRWSSRWVRDGCVLSLLSRKPQTDTHEFTNTGLPGDGNLTCSRNAMNRVFAQQCYTMKVTNDTWQKCLESFHSLFKHTQYENNHEMVSFRKISYLIIMTWFCLASIILE